ncbi:hypothetical protein D9601_17390 [Sphingomonas sp. MA1305]|jgi:hypothetical protein|uniref:TrbI F-type domain-containing protein n=1 Tax=Sphingomonas sp. MA1305 TaxID=2479204 RepID=UPI0018DEF16B|nr:TrbI F-type domain-containing protein [Sphingomonas sp. MA1305]MBI0477124.1 hypothetical protein [Sphingomonas sp. MA1305]
MADQPELDLPPPLPRQPTPAAARGFAGLTRAQLLVGVLLLGAAIWAMWVTRSLASPHQDRIVSARLSSIVGEYVTAQARSAAPPAQVEAEMKAFMAGLDREIQRRSASGEVVLVGEAVLTKNVPDITDSLKRAVFASGVPLPHQASAVDLQRLQQQAAAVQALPAAAGPYAAPAFAGPTAPLPPAAPVGVAEPGAPAATSPMPTAAVATFGGPDAGGNR